MTVYVVTWNLNKERSGYAQARREFIANLENYENTADPGLESVRWISTQESARVVREALKVPLDANDRLFVARLGRGEYSGWLNPAVWKWISARN